jgi:crossover junction endodeoxyribonuclease RuvC
VHLRVLGIDPGSRFCGFGVVEDAGGARFRHLQHGVIALDERAPMEERLSALHAGLARALAEHRPTLVAVEEVYFARNPRSALVLGQARGVALLAAAQAGAAVRSFSAAVIKQAVTGSGRAEKEQVGRMVDVLLGITVHARSDASDALAAAICGLLRARDPAFAPPRGASEGRASPGPALRLAELVAEAKAQGRAGRSRFSRPRRKARE